MSGRLVSLVFESALPAWVKQVAAAFATFAADDGSRVFPSERRIAWMIGRSERQVQRAVAELRRLGILEVRGLSGRATTTRYHFHAARLPERKYTYSLSTFDFSTRRMAKARLKNTVSTVSTSINTTPMSPRSVSISSSYKYTRSRAKTGTKD